MSRLPTLFAANPAILGLTGSPPGGVEMAGQAQPAETSLKTSCRVPLPSPTWAALSPTEISDRAGGMLGLPLANLLIWASVFSSVK